MTELEGAILGFLREGRDITPYAVRRAFQASPSAEWSGSAGAVYPAIRRLEASGLIKGRAEKADGRGTRTYALTDKGRVAHDGWLTDIARASDPGMDPFRTRSGMWFLLPPAKRRALMKALREETARRLAEFEARYATQDANDRRAYRLHILQLRSRLEWLKGEG